MVGISASTFVGYRVQQLIGVGATGSVYQGYDLQTDRRVAIKALRTQLPPEVNHWIAEKLSLLIDQLPYHSAAAALWETGVKDQEPYFVSDCAVGEPLDQVLEHFGPGAIADVLPRLRAIADALDQAAAHGIRHGALHPPDVIVSQDWTVITGIGVAEILDEAGMTVPNRAPYVAPELMAGEFPSNASDQFSLSAIAFEWLFGELISGPAIARIDVPDIPGLNRTALSDVFTTALASTSSERFTSCHAFVDGLSACVSKAVEPVPEVAVSPTDRPIELEGQAWTEPDVTFEWDDPAPAFPEAFGEVLVGPKGRDGEEPRRVVEVRFAREMATSRYTPALTRTRLVTGLKRFGRSLAGPRPLDRLKLLGQLVSITPPDGVRRLVCSLARLRRLDRLRDPGGQLAAITPRDSVQRFGRSLLAALRVRHSRSIGLALATMLLIAIGWAVGGLVTTWRLRPVAEPVSASPVLVDRVADTEPSGSAIPSPLIVTAQAVVPPQKATAATDVPIIDSMPAKSVADGDARTQASRDDERRSTPATAPVSPRRDARPASRAPSIARRQAAAPAETRPPAPPRLAPDKRGNGSLLIESRPSGAAIAINGMARGRTPLKIGVIPAGDYSVMLTLPKFQPLSVTVHVTAGEDARVGPSMTPQEPQNRE